MGKTKLEQVERFDAKIESKLTLALDKLLNIGDVKPISENNAIKIKKLPIMDCANVVMLVAKTDRMKLVLRRFIDVDRFKEERPLKIPSLDFEGHNNGKESISKFSVDYVIKILNVYKILQSVDVDSLEIAVNKDYPMLIKTEDFDVILAPRVENY